MCLTRNELNEINAKYVRIHDHEYTERMFASNLPYRDRKLNLIHKQILKNPGGDGKRWPLTLFPSLASRIPPRESRASLPPRRSATTCCWLSLGPGDLCANLSQSFTFAESRKPNFWTCVCICTFSFSAFAFLIEINKSLFVIWLLSPQRFHYYFYFSIVSWQYQKYWNVLILVLCLLCVTPLVCSSYSSFAPSSPFFSSWWKKYCELFTHTLVLQCSPSTSSRQPQTTHVFADREDCFYYCS